MGEETLDRKEFIGRIGTFFLVMGMIALMIFIATDISRSDKSQADKQRSTALAAVAIQTQNAGAQQARLLNLPTPTLVPVVDLKMTQDLIEYGVLALQTRDAAARSDLRVNLPTPTMIDPAVLMKNSQSISYFSFFCVAALGISAGFLLLRMTASPAKTSGRFEGLRKMRQKQKEAREKREAAKKEKEAKKKK